MFECVVTCLLQVSVLEQLAKLLESSDVDRTADEDLDSMRDEARRKLAEVNEVILRTLLTPLFCATDSLATTSSLAPPCAFLSSCKCCCVSLSTPKRRTLQEYRSARNGAIGHANS